MEQVLTCWLCERPIETRLQWHHLVPRAKKGRETVAVHPICHKAIHASFNNAQLARIGADRDVILSDEAVVTFLEWIRDQTARLSCANQDWVQRSVMKAGGSLGYGNLELNRN